MLVLESKVRRSLEILTMYACIRMGCSIVIFSQYMYNVVIIILYILLLYSCTVIEYDCVYFLALSYFIMKTIIYTCCCLLCEFNLIRLKSHDHASAN